MRRLPAIFRGPAGDSNGFLRALVAVLEATTQDLDARISGLGRLADPATTPDGWLDFLAGWFGTPWRPDLPTSAKRALLQAMPDLLRTRGTRAGLRLFFDKLLPGALVSLTDTAVDYRPAVLGAGAALPAILLGRPPGLAGLGEARARLGHMRLKCANDVEDPLSRLSGRVRVVLSLSADDRPVWEPILAALVPDFIPAGLALDLRFRAAVADGLGRRLDVNLRLAGRPRAVLGGAIPTGRAVVGGEGLNLADGALAGGVRLN
jgi:phage tail-like protein